MSNAENGKSSRVRFADRRILKNRNKKSDIKRRERQKNDAKKTGWRKSISSIRRTTSSVGLLKISIVIRGSLFSKICQQQERRRCTKYNCVRVKRMPVLLLSILLQRPKTDIFGRTKTGNEGIYFYRTEMLAFSNKL
jgi:hypothetical protein